MHKGRDTSQRTSSIWKRIGVQPRGAALHSTIAEGFSYEVFVEAIEMTGLKQYEFVACLGISPATLNRRAKLGKFTSSESDNIYRFISVYVAIVELFEGDLQYALNWMKAECKGLGNNKPLALLSTSAGCKAVTEMVGRLEFGVFA